MIGYLQDDGGRQDAGYKGKASDCVVRAFYILTGADYADAYKEFACAEQRFGKSGKRSARNGICNKAIQYVFEANGLVRISLGRGVKPTYSEAHERYGDCIVRTRGHVCAIIRGNLMDTFDNRGYWWDPIMERKYGNDHQEKPYCGYTTKTIDGVKTHYGPERIEWRERKAMSVWVKSK